MRMDASVTHVRIESEIGLPNGPSRSTSNGKWARFRRSRPIPSYDSPSCPMRHVIGGVSFSASYNPLGPRGFQEKEFNKSNAELMKYSPFPFTARRSSDCEEGLYRVGSNPARWKIVRIFRTVGISPSG